MGGEDLGDHGAHERQRRQVGAPSLAFALQPGVREGGEDDVALPSGQGASLEMIEAEFVLQFLILLLDRPALVREAHQRAQRRGRRQVDEIVLGPIARAEGAFAEEPDLGRESAVAPVVRGRDARRTEPGPPAGCVPLRHDTTRHARAGCAAAQARASMADTSGARVRRATADDRGPRAAPAPPGPVCRRRR